jgi:putative transposase
LSTPAHRKAPGASYFVTTKCWEGRAVFQVTETAGILLSTLLGYRDTGAYLLHEFVIMPDHLHLLLTPARQMTLEKAIQLIKGGSSYRIHKLRGSRMEIWQVGFYDWTIRDADDWQAKVTYIRMNPVRARLVEKAEDWAHSSVCDRYALDAIPDRYTKLSSGAKAPPLAASMRGLKSPPPKEKEKPAAEGKAAKA